MIASLMMYARPQLAETHARFWALIRTGLAQEGIESPDHLSQTADEFFVWQHPQLVLSQTCGMPYRSRLYRQVKLVGTPDYGLQDCPPGYYRSALIVRSDDAREDLAQYHDVTFAYNQSISQSGYAAPYWHCTPRGFWFANKLHTQSHLESARAVAEGRADIASLDAVTWRLALQHESFASALRVLEWTTPTPGLPLITSMAMDETLIFAAVESAIHALSAEDRRDLGIRGIERIEKSCYLAVPNPDLPECDPDLK